MAGDVGDVAVSRMIPVPAGAFPVLPILAAIGLVDVHKFSISPCTIGGRGKVKKKLIISNAACRTYQ